MICLLLVSTVLGTGAVYAEGDDKSGSVEITVADFAAGTVLNAVEAAVYENGEYVLNENFADVPVDFSDLGSASKAQAAAELLADAAVSAEPAYSGTVGEDGKAVFASLDAENKLYVIFQTNNYDVVKISPMLVVLPYYNDNDEAVYSVSVDAKYEDVRVKEYFGALILNKKGHEGMLLQGAEFRLEKRVYLTDGESLLSGVEVYNDEGTGSYFWKTVAEDLVSDKNGQIVVKDLPFGVYRFVETKAPEGYMLAKDPMEAVVDKEGTVKLERGIYVCGDGEITELDFENEEESVEPSEPSEPSVPTPSEPTTKTGEDITKFIVIGCVVGVSLIVVIILVVITSKKKK